MHMHVAYISAISGTSRGGGSRGSEEHKFTGLYARGAFTPPPPPPPPPYISEPLHYTKGLIYSFGEEGMQLRICL